jgi:dienelactone hydrolase
MCDRTTIQHALLMIGMAVAFGRAEHGWAEDSKTQISNLLLGSNGRAIVSESEWLGRRKVLREKWLKVLGDLPRVKPPLKPQMLEEERLSEFTRSWVRYQVEEGVFTDGYLLVPRGVKGRAPAVVVFHPTTPLQARGVAGVEPDYPLEKRQGVQLVSRGYIVWCPRNFINREGADWAENTRRVLANHPAWTGMTRMIWDAMRAVDYLESLPNVDAKRIGCLGHSLGGKEVLYAMAFEERYRAGVSSEGGIGIRFSNWDAPWYLGAKANKVENDEVLALLAPRAFLLLAGDSADGERSRASIEAVKPIYRLFGAEEKVVFHNHHQGHSYPAEARQVAEEFLDKSLKRGSDSR